LSNLRLYDPERWCLFGLHPVCAVCVHVAMVYHSPDNADGTAGRAGASGVVWTLSLKACRRSDLPALARAVCARGNLHGLGYTNCGNRG